MILFLLLVTALAFIAAMALLLAMRRARSPAVDRARVNVAIFRERKAELDAERVCGRIDDAQHAALVADLQRLLVDDVESDVAPVSAPAGTSRRLPVAIMVLVPLLSLGIYLATGFDETIRDWLQLGDRMADVAALPQPLTNDAVAAQGLSLADAARVTQASLLRRPADAEAWYRLGITWLELELPVLGVESLRTARRLAPDNTDIAITLARVELALNRNQLNDDIRALLDAVLAQQPGHQGVLMVYGMAAFESGDFATAAARWQQLLALIDPASDGAALLRQSIDKAAQRAALARAGGAGVPVHVVLAPAMGAVPASATLFVSVRAAGGPPMPIAAKKLPPVLPVDVKLGDADQVMPGAPLAARGPLEVRARISLTGSPMAATGDIESAPLRVTLPLDGPVTLTLDRRVP